MNCNMSTHFSPPHKEKMKKDATACTSDTIMSYYILCARVLNQSAGRFYDLYPTQHVSLANMVHMCIYIYIF